MLKSLSASLGSLVFLSQSCQLASKPPSLPFEYTAPLEISGNLVQVPVSLNGASPELFILDTGLSGMIISENYATVSHARRTGETTTITGSGGQAVRTLEVAKNLLVNVEGLQWPIPTAKIAPAAVTDPIYEATGLPFHGMVGAFLFETYVVRLDFQSEKLTLFSPENFQYSGNGIILPLTFRNRKPYVDIKIQSGSDTPPKQGTVLLDLGSSRSLDLRGDIAPSPNFPKRHLLGFGGESLLPIGRIHRLMLGTHIIENPVTTFETSGTAQPGRISGRIGNQILSQFTVIFNYPQKQVILEPIASPTPQQADMSGLRLKQDLGSDHGILVDEVYPNSPAQEVGMQPGDRLLELDGQAVEQFSLAEIRQQLMAQPQTTRRLSVQRGQKTLSFNLELRQLI